MNNPECKHCNRIVLVISCVVLLMTGCNKYEVSTIEELEELAYNPPKEIRKTITQGDFEFTIDYLPTEILLLSEYSYLKELEERGANEQSIQKQKDYLIQYRKGYDSSLQFKLIITPVGDSDLIYAKMGGGFDSYSQWLQKLLFGIKEEITLKTKNGTEIPLIDYRMDRNYGTLKSRTFLLTFSKEWNGEDILDQTQISIRLDEFGLGTGRIIVNYSLPFPEITFNSDPSDTSP